MPKKSFWEASDPDRVVAESLSTVNSVIKNLRQQRIGPGDAKRERYILVGNGLGAITVLHFMGASSNQSFSFLSFLAFCLGLTLATVSLIIRRRQDYMLLGQRKADKRVFLLVQKLGDTLYDTKTALPDDLREEMIDTIKEADARSREMADELGRFNLPAKLEEGASYCFLGGIWVGVFSLAFSWFQI